MLLLIWVRLFVPAAIRVPTDAPEATPLAAIGMPVAVAVAVPPICEIFTPGVPLIAADTVGVEAG